MADKTQHGVPSELVTALSERAQRHDLLLAGLSQYLEVDVTQFVDANGEYLPYAEWTPAMRVAVKEIRRDPKTGVVTRFLLHDRLAVQAMLLRIAGLGGTKSEEGRARLDALEEVARSQPRAVPPPLRAVAVGVPGDQPVDAGRKMEKAARRERNRAAFYAARAEATAAKKRAAGGGGEDG